MEGRSLFAVIPAAGLSRRMGQPKLLLRLGKKSVIERLLDALVHSQIEARVVVIRDDDTALADVVAKTSATVVRPATSPRDMRKSVELALEEIQRRFAPKPTDGWMLVPADHPILDASVILQLLDLWANHSCSIMVPTFQGRRGHPTFFAWSLVEKVAAIPVDCGLNTLLGNQQVLEVPVDNPAVVTDLDTPDDFERLKSQWRDSP